MKMYKRANGEYAKPAASGKFTPTGEFRAPRKGEWYLSGAIPEAYRAPNDLSTPYHILRETV